MMGMGSTSQFSQKDMDNAKLPPPPEEDSELNILLRPGLLADVEIIIEKVPNAIYVPNQSVFEKDGKPLEIEFNFVGNDALQKTIAELLQGELAKVGISIRLTGDEADAFSNINTRDELERWARGDK